MVTDQRKFKRTPIKMNLEVSSLFKQDNIQVKNLNAPIEIIDISKEGIGFNSSSILPVGFYFNCRLQFPEIKSINNAINCVVQIIREKALDNGMINYGCIYIGMPAVYDNIFNQLENNYEEDHR
ncbi:MAG: PilZ domain-containing protein [Lachnospiraceae bacterium]|jgi:hypothetical protein|nr:PilZ domain-containing protein [Lachnospiraceae bacterium]MEE3461150.1 PilZ domain-containing protein [Lachnospiraceae bacterium]